jgi:hypothetical protein
MTTRTSRKKVVQKKKSKTQREADLNRDKKGGHYRQSVHIQRERTKAKNETKKREHYADGLNRTTRRAYPPSSICMYIYTHACIFLFFYFFHMNRGIVSLHRASLCWGERETGRKKRGPLGTAHASVPQPHHTGDRNQTKSSQRHKQKKK